MQESHAPEDKPVMEEPLGALGRLLLEAYLRGKGYLLQSLHELPEEQAKQLMMEASSYVSARLAEVEAGAQFMHEIEDTSRPI